jgi:peptide/nickel transport system ATP-binding protein
VEPTAGKVTFKETDVTALSPQQMRRMRQKMQIVFQDPYESLNPRMSTYDILAEPLQLQQVTRHPEEIDEKVEKILEDMGLVPPEEFMYRFPHELSGGQRQRVAIGRAFILDPEFIVADEPVSMLDASIRSEVVKLMQTMVAKRGITFLYITHDLALTRYLCNRIAVMYLGKIVEVGPSEEIVDNPHHPYAEALIAAVPVPDPTVKRTKILIKGEVPSPVNPPPGCRFHPRCPYSKDKCRKEEPKPVNSGKDRLVACHFPLS